MSVSRFSGGEPRVALVTGANRGLGLETAKQLLIKGLRVAMTGRDEAATERARRTLGDLATHAITVRVDVTNPRTIDAARATIGARLGTVDVLVNNAAILLGEGADVFEISSDDYEETIRTN